MAGIQLTIGTWRIFPEFNLAHVMRGVVDGVVNTVVRAPHAHDDCLQLLSGVVPFVFFYVVEWIPAITPNHETAHTIGSDPSSTPSTSSCSIELATDVDLRRLHVGPLGFLPDTAVTVLKTEYYQPWERLVSSLAELNKSGRIRDAIAELPLLQTGLLTKDVNALRRAYVLLGQLAHSWMNNHKVCWEKLHNGHSYDNTTTSTNTNTNTKTKTNTDATTNVTVDTNNDSSAHVAVFPVQLARPWFEVCQHLGLPTVITASATDLWNYVKIDPDGRIEPRNLKLVSSCTSTDSETHFHTIPCTMNAVFGENGLPLKIFNLPYHIEHSNIDHVVDTLRGIKIAVTEFKTIFKQAKELVKVDVFYNIYRPLLGGFSPRTACLTGAGVNGTDVIVDWKGPSAGQSPMIVMLDIVLGVSHSRGSMSRLFQDEMVTRYMTPSHAQLLRTLELRINTTTSTKQFATNQGGQVEILFNECVTALHEFRRYHLAVATKYLKATTTGTGNSSFRDMLKEFNDDTAQLNTTTTATATTATTTVTTATTTATTTTTATPR